MNTNQNMQIFAAVGPRGDIIKTSVSVFAAEAKRWAAKRNGYTVQALTEVPTTFVAKRGPGRPRRAETAEAAPAATTAKRGRGRPRKSETVAAAPVAAKVSEMDRKELLGKKHIEFLKQRLEAIEKAVRENKTAKRKTAAANTETAPNTTVNQ